MLSLTGMVTIVVYLIVAGLVFWLLWWLINYIAPPEPFRKVANVVLAIMAVLVVIGILLSLVGGTPIFRP
jgi:heme A synthase